MEYIHREGPRASAVTVEQFFAFDVKAGGRANDPMKPIWWVESGRNGDEQGRRDRYFTLSDALVWMNLSSEPHRSSLPQSFIDRAS